MASGDSLDRVFVDYLKEIERSYISIPKSLRIRIEKWVEKLVSTGRNPTWRKHRNAYAKLLLNMILTKSLSDPFHIPPPDGPLSTFPSHLVGANSRDLLGPHESSFWRELYRRMNTTEVDSGQAITNESHIGSTIGSIQETKSHREIQNLQLLIREQTERISLLEQQLRDERTQHELQLQRQTFTHKIELTKLKDASASSLDECIHGLDRSVSLDRSAVNGPTNSVNGGGSDIRRSPDQQRHRSPGRDQSMRFLASDLPRHTDFGQMNERLTRMFAEVDKQSKGPSVANSSPGSGGTRLGFEGSLSHVRRPASASASASPEQRSSLNLDRSPNHLNRLSAPSPVRQARSNHHNNGSDTTGSNNGYFDDNNNDDYMKYLDSFQAEIRDLAHNSIPGDSARYLSRARATDFSCR